MLIEFENPFMIRIYINYILTQCVIGYILFLKVKRQITIFNEYGMSCFSHGQLYTAY